MKSITALFIIALLITALFGTVTYAQDVSPVETPEQEGPPAPPDELPDTAAGTLPFIEQWLTFLAAMIGLHVMSLVKKIPGLGKQEWFQKLTTELVAGVTVTVLAYLLALVAIAAGFLDQSGIWAVVRFAWPAMLTIYHGKKFGRVGTALAK